MAARRDLRDERIESLEREIQRLEQQLERVEIQAEQERGAAHQQYAFNMQLQTQLRGLYKEYHELALGAANAHVELAGKVYNIFNRANQDALYAAKQDREALPSPKQQSGLNRFFRYITYQDD